MVTLEKLVNCYESLYDEIAEYEKKGNTSMVYGFFIRRAFNTAEYLLGALILKNLGIDKENRRHLRDKEPWRLNKYIEEEFERNPSKYLTERGYLPNLRKNLIEKMRYNKII